MSDEGQPWTQEQLLRFVDAVFREVTTRLVSEPVEPEGILSRIEQHVAVLRDFHHGAFSGDASALAVLLLHACHWQYDHALELLREVHLERQKANAP